MNTPTTALETLRALAEISREMVAFALKCDWDGLSAAQQQQQALFSRLESCGPLRQYAATPETATLIREILAAHEKIGSQVTPWMEQVTPLLKAFAPREG